MHTAPRGDALCAGSCATVRAVSLLCGQFRYCAGSFPTVRAVALLCGQLRYCAGSFPTVRAVALLCGNAGGARASGKSLARQLAATRACAPGQGGRKEICAIEETGARTRAAPRACAGKARAGHDETPYSGSFQVRRRWMVHYKSRVAKGRSYSSLVFFWGTSSSASRRFLEEESRFVLSSG